MEGCEISVPRDFKSTSAISCSHASAYVLAKWPSGKNKQLVPGSITTPLPLPGRTSTERSSLLFKLHLVDHQPRVIAQGHRLPTQNLLSIIQVNLRVLWSRQLRKRVLKGTERIREGGRGGSEREGQKEKSRLQKHFNVCHPTIPTKWSSVWAGPSQPPASE